MLTVAPAAGLGCPANFASMLQAQALGPLEGTLQLYPSPIYTSVSGAGLPNLANLTFTSLKFNMSSTDFEALEGSQGLYQTELEGAHIIAGSIYVAPFAGAAANAEILGLPLAADPVSITLSQQVQPHLGVWFNAKHCSLAQDLMQCSALCRGAQCSLRLQTSSWLSRPAMARAPPAAPLSMSWLVTSLPG